MGKHPRELLQLFHLTALENLPSIVQHGVLSRAEIRRRGLAFANVADAGILDGRARHGLDEYVPFHFFPKNPFDGRVMLDHPGKRFALLAVSRTLAASQGWFVIPRHPLADNVVPEILPWTQGIARINWDRMTPGPQRDYRDAGCRSACMAEALRRAPVLLAEIQAIYVRDDADRQRVVATLAGRTSPFVNVAPWWV